MTRESITALMSQFVDFINTADEKLANELISPDAIFYVPGGNGPMHGPSGYLSIIGMMRSGFADIQWHLEQVIIEGSDVAARFSMTGTHSGNFFNVPASGKKINVSAINLYRFSDRKIVEEYGQPDMLGLLAQIGALPATN